MSKSEIFSGEDSVEMWREINDAKTIKDLRDALYNICCKLQKLEYRIEKLQNPVEITMKDIEGWADEAWERAMDDKDFPRGHISDVMKEMLEEEFGIKVIGK